MDDGERPKRTPDDSGEESGDGSGRPDFAALIEHLGDGVAFHDIDRRCLLMNPAMIAARGPIALEIGRTARQVRRGSPQVRHYDERLRTAIESGRSDAFTLNHVGEDGAVLVRNYQLLPVLNDGGACTGVFVVARDATPEEMGRRAERRLHRALRMLSSGNQILLHATDESRLLADVCRVVVEVGGYPMAWVGYAEHDGERRVRPMAVVGPEAAYLDEMTITWDERPTGRGPSGTAVREGRTVINRDFLRGKQVAPWRAGALAHGFQSSIALPLAAEGGPLGCLNIYSDHADSFGPDEVALLEEMAADLAFGIVTLRSRRSREEAEARLRFLAGHDALTGLPNRSTMRERFDAIVAENGSDRPPPGPALLLIDLDHFKQVNENLDHQTGDTLLIAIADRLRLTIGDRGGDVGRAGGDEFIILHDDAASAEETAARLIAAMVPPFIVDDAEVVVSISIGITRVCEDASDFTTLMRQAGTALQRAKEDGRATFRVHTAEMSSAASDRWRLFAALRNALDQDEFSLHYQPQVRAGDGSIVGVEALIRWHRPDSALPTPPGLFIPEAERCGLIVPMGEWVLREACATAARWSRWGLGSPTIAVNLSARQFHRGDLLATVTGVLSATGLDPERLELELTESILLDDTEKAIGIIGALKDIGVRFSIDDFGTGYSSLSYLRRLAVDKLKIDQSFVWDLETADGRAIVNAIINLGRALELTIIAEGVETPEQRDFLARGGCDVFQGYLYSRPLPAGEMVEALRRGVIEAQS